MDVSGSASKVPRQRRATDWDRLVVSGIVVTFAALRVGHPTAFERQLFTLINTLPGGLRGLFTRVYQLANLWANGLILIPALVARRWRLARDVLLAGLLALVVARILGAAIQEGLVRGLDVAVRVGKGPTFPLLRLSVATAVVAAAAPYLTRPPRWLGRTTLAVVAPAAMYLGLAYPNDVLAALALGWGVAAAVHLAFGSPAGRPTVPRSKPPWRNSGCPRSVSPSSLTSRRERRALPRMGPGDGCASRCSGGMRPAQLFSKLWRSMFYKESGRTLQLTRLQQVEHEAYMVLAARSAGVRAPEVVAAGMAGPGAAILVVRDPSGTPLTELAVDALTDDVLAGVWEQASRLHAARLVHGQLHASTVVVTSEGPAITAFEFARTGRSSRDEGGDIAELLASLAGLVGPERALRSALAGVEGASLIRALPLLQPAALSARTRGRARLPRQAQERPRRPPGGRGQGHRHRAACAAGTAPDQRRQPRPCRGGIGSGGRPDEPCREPFPAPCLHPPRPMEVAGGGLRRRHGHKPPCRRGPFRDGHPWPAALAHRRATGGALVLERGGSSRGACDAGPFLAASWLGPGRGDRGGRPSVDGRQRGRLGPRGGAGADALPPHSVHIASLPKNLPAIALISLLGLGVAAALVLGLPMLRRMVVPPLKHAAAELWNAVRSPRRLGLMLGGNIAVALLFGLSLSACLVAFGAHVSAWSVIAVAVGISGIAALVPIPGGGTAVSAVGMSGALVALGVGQVTAVGAVLANQVVATYLPAIPGWFATGDLVKRDHL